MPLGPLDPSFHLSPAVREQLPSDVDPDRLEAFLAHCPEEERAWYLELALQKWAVSHATPSDAPPARERVVSIELAGRPRGLRFGDADQQAAWQAVFRRGR